MYTILGKVTFRNQKKNHTGWTKSEEVHCDDTRKEVLHGEKKGKWNNNGNIW